MGIDHGQALLINGGVRGNHDMVSIGTAPNVAAKLSALRHDDGGKTVNITSSTYWSLNDAERRLPSGDDRWTQLPSKFIGGTPYTIYATGYFKEP